MIIFLSTSAEVNVGEWTAFICFIFPVRFLWNQCRGRMRAQFNIWIPTLPLSVLSQWSWMVINSEKKDLYGLVGLKIIFVALDTHFNQVWFIWSSAAYFNIDKLWSLQSRDNSRCQDDNFDRICPLRSFVHHVKFEG